MGYGYYVLPDGREAGYAVEATCDVPGCRSEIDRGLDYLCGDSPDGHRDPDDPGCGKYHCPDHQGNHACPNQGCGAYPCQDCEGGMADPCWLLSGHDGKHMDEEGYVFTNTEESCEE